MECLQLALFALLILCALATVFTKNLLSSVIVYMAYSTIMAIVWILMEAPDLAITEAAVGAGISSLLFFLVLRRIRLIRKEDAHEQE